ncbi:MAG: hypothetical protein A2289_24535 [Deltaproteobacteria bacterium RIFOXYA12_FULL_58_15]|nr:MAG: hypothetical protein A2289_24535 [Deltaproteobacteria bacterium RIFOXYA12_FULL_58_15]OGR12723.1 MAG: hypothetical protein A2341_07885 [Deltaproteobacteria bacterium RIFOXYB12_FULL_58_9]
MLRTTLKLVSWIGLLAAGVWIGVGIDDDGRVLGQEVANLTAQHQLEVTALGHENTELQNHLHALEDENADLVFMLGHATLQLKSAQQETPSYDFERFLRYNPEARKYMPYLSNAIDKYEDTWPVDPMFALAIMKQESNFGEHIVSKAGALGDAQFIEATGRRYGLHSNEPWSWKNERQKFVQAGNKRRLARESRDRFLDKIGIGLDVNTGRPEKGRHLAMNFERNVAHLIDYFDLLREASQLEAEGDQAYRVYRNEIYMALDHARDLEQETRQRLQREETLMSVSGVGAPRTPAQRETAVQLVVNDYLNQVDPRLSPMMVTDALVHHLADLFQEFKGDKRLVASRYNASRRAMEASVASVGGGVGIPLIYETQNYVNRVVALQAFFAMDAGILDDTLRVSRSYASR